MLTLLEKLGLHAEGIWVWAKTNPCNNVSCSFLTKFELEGLKQFGVWNQYRGWGESMCEWETSSWTISDSVMLFESSQHYSTMWVIFMILEYVNYTIRSPGQSIEYSFIIRVFMLRFEILGGVISSALFTWITIHPSIIRVKHCSSMYYSLKILFKATLSLKIPALKVRYSSFSYYIYHHHSLFVHRQILPIFYIFAPEGKIVGAHVMC